MESWRPFPTAPGASIARSASSANSNYVRIGLDCGEPVEDSNDLFGRTVQLAARLCAAAAADQILVSETVSREHGDGALFKAAEQRQLKGFAEPVSLAECVWQAAKIPDGAI